MDIKAAADIGAGLAVIALAGVGVGIGNIFAALVTSVARNPAARDKVFGLAILGFALTEAVALYALVIAFIILFVSTGRARPKQPEDIMSKLVALLRRTAPLAVALFCVPFSAMAEEGMPQLDFGNKLTISQMVWLVIIFPVFYLLVSRWALPQVGAVIEMRAARIAQDLDAARAAKVEADAAVAEQTTAIRAAQTGAQTEIANAVAKAKQEAAAEAATLNARLDAQISEAEQRIDVARTTALGALRQVASETTMAVVLRLTGAAPNAAAVEQAVGAQLAARGQ